MCRLPAEQVSGSGTITDKLGRITWPSRHDVHTNWTTSDSLNDLDDLSNRVTAGICKKADKAQNSAEKIIESLHMAVCYVRHMYKIADARTIRRIIVRTKQID